MKNVEDKLIYNQNNKTGYVWKSSIDSSLQIKEGFAKTTLFFYNDSGIKIGKIYPIYGIQIQNDTIIGKRSILFNSKGRIFTDSLSNVKIEQFSLLKIITWYIIIGGIGGLIFLLYPTL